MKKSDMIPGQACQLSPGTETAQYVLSRTLKNSPVNEGRLRGILISHKKWLLDEDGGERADLQGANLRRADLRRADLQRANLQRADLRRADLQRADLQGANLRRADLRRADLRGADLRGADLRRADLRRADLQGANLQGANLRGADLQGANLDYSSFPLWCGLFGVKVDTRLFAQISYHLCRMDVPEELVQYQDALRDIAKQFHRFDECYGLPEPKEVPA